MAALNRRTVLIGAGVALAAAAISGMIVGRRTCPRQNRPEQESEEDMDF